MESRFLFAKKWKVPAPDAPTILTPETSVDKQASSPLQNSRGFAQKAQDVEMVNCIESEHTVQMLCCKREISSIRSYYLEIPYVMSSKIVPDLF